MRPQCLLLALAILPWSTGAQPPASIEAEREENAVRLAAKSGRERLDLLLELVQRYHTHDPKQALAFADEALQLLATWGDDERKRQLHRFLPWIHLQVGDYESGLKYAEESHDMARASGDRKAVVRSLRAIAYNQEATGALAAALKTFREARALSLRLDGYQLGGILSAIGDVYAKLGDLEEGLKYQERAYRYFEERERPLGVAVTLSNVASLYHRLGRYQEALEYYERVLEILRQRGDHRRVALTLSDLGDTYRASGDPSRALTLHRQSLAIVEELELRRLIASALGDIGADHHALGEFEQADASYRRALSLWREEDDPRQTAGILVAFGKLERERGRYRAARERLERGVALFEQAKEGADVDQIHEEAVFELAETYRAVGRDRDALRTFGRYNELLIERLEREKSRNLAEMQVRFDVDLKEKEIELLEQQKQLQTLELEYQRDSRRALLAVFGLVLLLLALVFNRSRLKTRAAMMQQTVERERSVSARLRQIDRLKDEFLANTSHELRTPLYGITGLAESLIDGAAGEVPEEVKANLSMIVSSSRRLSQLVNDILDHSRLSHRSLKLRRRPVDLRSLADVVMTLHKPLAAGKDLELSNAVPADLPAADADEARLEQILHNLVGNAVKFTEAGRVEISAKKEDQRLPAEERTQPAAGGERVKHPPAEEHARLVVIIEDTGIGIAADQRQRIFEAFEQAESGVQRAFGGTGLGLTVTRELIELHGGRIWVESTLGQGSKFFFTLPISDQEPESAPSSEQPVSRVLAIEPVAQAQTGKDSEHPPAPEGRERILVVDDEAVNLQVLSSHLASAGYRVELAASGAEALRLEAERSFDLVVLDVMMPGLSGYEVCRSIREHHSLEELPVIFLTAKNQVPDLVAGLAEGGNDYLAKPIGKDELLARVKTHLALRAVHRKLSELVDERTAQLAEREQMIAERERLIGELETRNAELARFNHTIAHDLKNPLTTIRNFIGMLERDEAAGDRARLRQDLRRIDIAASNLHRLLDELVELSSINEATMRYEDVGLGGLVRQALAENATTLAERGIQVEVAPDLPAVYGDRVRLLEVVRHLLANAVRYLGDRPSPWVEVGIRDRAPDRESPVIYVRDNGIGIDPRYHDKVFELFERLDPGASEGTGVGLALAQRIIEAHGGRIWVESDGAGRGSTFCFTLPGKMESCGESWEDSMRAG